MSVLPWIVLIPCPKVASPTKLTKRSDYFQGFEAHGFLFASSASRHIERFAHQTDLLSQSVSFRHRIRRSRAQDCCGIVTSPATTE
jgi:hypothetical protein